jgi:transcription initiation factor TFIID subunit 5
MSEEIIKNIVYNYLERKGYKKALENFEKEVKRDVEVTDLTFTTSNLPNTSISNSMNETSKLLNIGYQNTSEWINSSLDLYKNELIQILYPIFVHCYLEMISKGFVEESKSFFSKYKSQHVHFHGNEIHTLEGVQTQSILTENELTQRFLKSKYDVRISQISFDLLMKYLQDSNDILILSIVNQFLNFKVFKGQPSSELLKNDSEFDFDDEKENLSLSKVSLDVKTASGPAKRGRKKKVHSTTSKSSIPSICCYTFFNANVNTIEFGVQNDKPLIIGGFEDSSIKYWKSESYEALYGHTGPVYGLSLSSDQKWLLSSSEDSTVRLWNLDTKSNIVVYKGHQYPG